MSYNIFTQPIVGFSFQLRLLVHGASIWVELSSPGEFDFFMVPYRSLSTCSKVIFIDFSAGKRQHGLPNSNQAFRRMPPPVNLPSLKSENARLCVDIGNSPVETTGLSYWTIESVDCVLQIVRVDYLLLTSFLL
jgi:hypothetical protein